MGNLLAIRAEAVTLARALKWIVKDDKEQKPNYPFNRSGVAWLFFTDTLDTSRDAERRTLLLLRRHRTDGRPFWNRITRIGGSLLKSRGKIVKLALDSINVGLGHAG